MADRQLRLGVAPNSSPSAYPGSNGHHYVYFPAYGSNDLHVGQWTGSQWQLDNLGQGVTGSGGPSSYLG